MFKAYRRFKDFRGRSGRKEFWLFVLLMIIQMAVAMGLDTALGLNFEADDPSGPITLLVLLANLIPYLALAFRRLHDTGRSAWWLLIGLVPIIGMIVLLVFYVFKGDPNANAFGAPDGADMAPDSAETVV